MTEGFDSTLNTLYIKKKEWRKDRNVMIKWKMYNIAYNDGSKIG